MKIKRLHVEARTNGIVPVAVAGTYLEPMMVGMRTKPPHKRLKAAMPGATIEPAAMKLDVHASIERRKQRKRIRARFEGRLVQSGRLMFATGIAAGRGSDLFKREPAILRDQ
ncbi:hypothetical protein [Paenibacillus sp. R14(2021)]|uniref:hypothetical protein n=1 Tax=Paenibacillus sp. R14(2021) TaxID=2859228 RepID=UPI001C612EB0|nr:hypothetical protein [Paenibacillus sp. R14(2021)]